MSFGSFPFFTSEVRLRGTYVYMLFCQEDGGPIYVKIGISDKPTDRMKALRASCPVRAKSFATVEVVSRAKAVYVEKMLLIEMERWKTVGEWIKLTPEDKPAFNAAWQKVFSVHRTPSWPMRWSIVSVDAVMKDAYQKMRFVMRKQKRRGKSYRDFQRHLSASNR